LVEIANASEAVQDGRIYIERVNGAFLEQGGTPDQYRAALARAIKLGWLWLHEFGTYVKLRRPGRTCSRRRNPKRNAWQGFGVFISEKSLGACHVPVAYRRL
jgi:hypothetical protein